MEVKVLKQCVGIDIAQKKFDCSFCVYTEELKIKVIASTHFPNTQDGLKKLCEWIANKQASQGKVYITMEATGVYHEEAAYYLTDKGFNLCLIQPTQGKQYAKSLGTKSKTDKIDAKMLACMGLERNLPLWIKPDPLFRTLKQLTRERIALIKDKNALTNQLHALNHSHKAFKDTIKRLEKRVTLIEKQKKAIEEQMNKISSSNKNLEDKLKHVLTIPGVSTITALSVISETDGFTNMRNRRQLISYVGLDVVLKESGTLAWRPRISKRGNSYIRAALYMPAVCSIIHNKALKIYYNRLKDGGKRGKIGIVALQRKILVLIYTLYKNGQDYDPEFLTKIESL